MLKLLILILMTMPGTLPAAESRAAEKIVIAHRGASGYLPEHTLEAKVLAHVQGADYIEQDVVMTRDDRLVVMHDLTLDRVTDVALRFPGRTREDGHYYVIDFTLDELRQLSVSEGRRVVGNAVEADFPGRFPPERSRFGIHTLSEEIELIQGLNRTLGREAGIYVEVKSPWFHHLEGKDAAASILQVLKDYGYDSPEDKVFLQSFDFDELVRVHDQLMPALDMDIPLVQLIARNEWEETMVRDKLGNLAPYDYEWMHSVEGLQKLACYVKGVGPSMDMIIDADSEPGKLTINPLVEYAHTAGLAVHPYTFRLDQERLPGYTESFEELLEIFLFQIGVDGVFTDFPDRAVAFLDKH